MHPICRDAKSCVSRTGILVTPNEKRRKILRLYNAGERNGLYFTLQSMEVASLFS